MSKINVLIDCERLKYKHTGLYEYCRVLATSLDKYKKNKDLNLKFYAPKKEHTIFDNNEYVVNQSFIHKLYFPKFKGINIFHSTYQNSSYFPHKNHKWKIILTIHDFNFLIEKQNDSKKENLLQKIKNKIDSSNVVIFISDYVMQQAIDFWGDSEKYHRIYNGINVNINKLPVSKPIIVDETKEFILALGTVLKKKMFHTLIPIIKTQNYNLIIAGITDDKNYLHFLLSEAKRYSVLEKVKIIGPVTETEKRWLYKNCKAFAFPSSAEGFGMPLIEAMLFGKLCFSSKHNALPEICGKYAYYFDDYTPKNMQKVFSKGIMDYYKGDTLKKQKEIITWASQYNIKSFSENYLNLYESLV